jgi:hypothetical protein
MGMTPKPQTQDTKRDYSQCASCGASDQFLVVKDVPIGTPGYAWHLVAVCRDAHGCADRRRQRDQHLDQRFELTPTGYGVLDESAPTIHHTSTPGRFVADSQTAGGVRYALEVLPDGRVACTCRGWEFHGHCKHADATTRVLRGRAMLRGAA